MKTQLIPSKNNNNDPEMITDTRTQLQSANNISTILDVIDNNTNRETKRPASGEKKRIHSK